MFRICKQPSFFQFPHLKQKKSLVIVPDLLAGSKWMQFKEHPAGFISYVI
jgi:hypothetical protein